VSNLPLQKSHADQ